MAALAAAIGACALLLFAQITGWAALARAYPLAGRFDGPGRPTAGVVIGPWGWNAPPLRVALDDGGIALAPVLPFRFFFRALHLPWAEVTAIEKREYLFFDVTRLVCGKDAVIGFLPSGVTAAIEERLARLAATDSFQEPKTPSP